MATKKTGKRLIAAGKKTVAKKAANKIAKAKKAPAGSPKPIAKKVAKRARKAAKAPVKSTQAAKATTPKTAPAPTNAAAKSKRAPARKATNAVAKSISKPIQQRRASTSTTKKAHAKPVPPDSGKAPSALKPQRDSSPEAKKRLALQHMQEALARKNELAQQPAPWQMIPHRHEPSEKMTDGVAPTALVTPISDESGSPEDGSPER